jgi:hypothetical protein
MHLTPDAIVQIAIAVIGVLAAWINQDPTERTRRWACVIGIVGQPFWFYTAWQANQWGVLAVTAGYTLAFMRGIKVYWLCAKPTQIPQEHIDTVPCMKYLHD